MAIRIENLPISSSNDNRILLNNSSVARTFDFGSSWNKIRIGLRWAMNYSGLPLVTDSSVNLKCQFDLYFGLMSTPSSSFINSPLSSNTNFVGYWNNIDFPWTEYVAGGLPYYYTNVSVSALTYGKKVVNTKTSFNGNAGAIRIPAFPDLARSIVMIEMAQSASTHVSANIWYPVGATATQRDYSKEELIAAMKTPDATTAKNYLGLLSGATANYGSTASGLYAFDQTVLDSFVISWSGNWSPLIISEVLVSKFS